MRLLLKEQCHVVHNLLMNCHISILRLSSTPYFYTSTMSIKLFIKKNMKLDLLLLHSWVVDILDWNKGNGTTVSSSEDEDSLGGLKASKHKFKPLLSQERGTIWRGEQAKVAILQVPYLVCRRNTLSFNCWLWFKIFLVFSFSSASFHSPYW